MKITDVRTFVVGNPWKNWVFVKAYTDAGITGLGEATGGLDTAPRVADVEELRRFVIGEDPLLPGKLWHRMYKGRYLNPSTGMTGIETACWDILGKHLGVPVWQLLGGKQRDSLRVYANGWYQGPREPGFFASRASEMVGYGYTALKFDPFGGAYLQLERSSEHLAIEIVRAVRAAVGDTVDILIEGHDRFSAPYASRVASLIAEFNPLFFETPVNSTNIVETVSVAAHSPVPIATGERFSRLSQFAEVLAGSRVRIVQPEVMHLGLANAHKACAIAEAFDAMVACHQAQSPLCTAINAHIHATIPNFLIHENFDDNLEPWTWDVLSGVPRVAEGRIAVPSAPGLGVELNEDEAARHPYGKGNFLRLFEDGWETRKPLPDTP